MSDRMHRVTAFADSDLADVALRMNRTLAEIADNPDMLLEATEIVPFVQTLDLPRALGGPTSETRFLGIVRYSVPAGERS